MKTHYDLGMLAAFAIIAIWLAAIWGWVLNILTIFESSFTPLTGQLVLRVIGVFVAPLGSILGYV